MVSVSDVSQTMSSTIISANKNFFALKKNFIEFLPDLKKNLLKDIAIAQNKPRDKSQDEFKETKINIKLV